MPQEVEGSFSGEVLGGVGERHDAVGPENLVFEGLHPLGVDRHRDAVDGAHLVAQSGVDQTALQSLGMTRGVRTLVGVFVACVVAVIGIATAVFLALASRRCSRPGALV